jgi:hypothetical protein
MYVGLWFSTTIGPAAGRAPHSDVGWIVGTGTAAVAVPVVVIPSAPAAVAVTPALSRVRRSTWTMRRTVTPHRAEDNF